MSNNKDIMDELKEQRKESNTWRSKTDERLSSIDVTNAVQNEQLKEHMKRTALAEGQIKRIDKRLNILERPLSVKKASAIAIAVFSLIAGAAKILTIFKL